ncbi:MAG: AAA family ATPase [Nanoarchaeota archaeon]
MEKPDIKQINECEKIIKDIKKEVNKVIVGQEKVLDGIIRGILCDGHVLVEGVPGIAKTLIVRALGKAVGGKTQRVQFTVDLLPTDIIGLITYTSKKGFEINKGPVFTNFLVADEINRSPPKTQSALLEAMQEKQVTIGKKTYSLPVPFFAMATQNPLENSGVYNLPEAEIDRFLFKLLMDYPTEENEVQIMERNISIKNFNDFGLKTITSPKKIKEMQEIVKKIYISHELKEYISKIIKLTRGGNFEYAEHIKWGASPRGSIGIFIASKANALMNGRNYVIAQDVKDVAFSVLRHRIILGYSARTKKITPDDIIKKILEYLPAP